MYHWVASCEDDPGFMQEELDKLKQDLKELNTTLKSDTNNKNSLGTCSAQLEIKF